MKPSYGYSATRDARGLWTGRLFVRGQLRRQIDLCSTREQALREVFAAMAEMQLGEELAS